MDESAEWGKVGRTMRAFLELILSAVFTAPVDVVCGIALAGVLGIARTDVDRAAHPRQCVDVLRRNGR